MFQKPALWPASYSQENHAIALDFIVETNLNHKNYDAHQMGKNRSSSHCSRNHRAGRGELATLVEAHRIRNHDRMRRLHPTRIPRTACLLPSPGQQNRSHQDNPRSLDLPRHLHFAGENKRALAGNSTREPLTQAF